MKGQRNGFKDDSLAWKILMNTSRKLKYARSLTKTDYKRLHRARQYDAEGPLSRQAKKHLHFLERVLQTGTTHYKLCVIAFSQNQIDSTKDAILDSLVKRIDEKRNEVADTRYGFHCLTADLKKPGTVPSPQELSQDKWVAFVSPGREDMKQVFRTEVVEKIESAQTSDPWGLVTMRFPKWRADQRKIPSYMNLELREDSVKELAMALFRVEVDWMENGLHVVHENKMLQIIPHSTFTLTRVLDDAVARVFQSDVYRAVSESPVRVRELAEGMIVTECVTLVVSRRGGAISLTMSLPGGVAVQNRLNANVL